MHTPHIYLQATEIYKRLLLENRGELALNVYVAMCYYKMDYYDVALEILAVYLQVRISLLCVLLQSPCAGLEDTGTLNSPNQHNTLNQAYPGSSVAVNLKACNHFRLYNGKAAEAELKALADQVRTYSFPSIQIHHSHATKFNTYI